MNFDQGVSSCWFNMFTSLYIMFLIKNKEVCIKIAFLIQYGSKKAHEIIDNKVESLFVTVWTNIVLFYNTFLIWYSDSICVKYQHNCKFKSKNN